MSSWANLSFMRTNCHVYCIAAGTNRVNARTNQRLIATLPFLSLLQITQFMDWEFAVVLTLEILDKAENNS